MPTAQELQTYYNNLYNIDHLQNIPTPPPSKSDIKSTRLAERTTSKLAQNGYADPTTNVISSGSIRSIDGDTYKVDGRDKSVRTLGVDTYESSKPNFKEWISNPNMQRKMDAQVVKLSGEIGRQATYSDVFAAGDAQKAEAAAYSNQPLPTLLQETLLTNNDTNRMKSGHIVNYGRDLGGLETVGGMYSLPDGTVDNGQTEVLNTDYQQAEADIIKYGSAKYTDQATQKPVLKTEAEILADIQRLSNTSDATGGDSFIDSLLRTPQAAISGAGKSVYDMADTGVEAAGNIGARALDTAGLESSATFIDKADLATDQEKTKQVNALIGYDDSYTKAIMQQSGKEYDAAMENVDLFSPSTWGNIKGADLLDSVTTALSTPETAGYSLGYLVPALIGVLEKGTIKLMSKAGQKSAMEVADIAKDTVMTKAAKREAIKDITSKLPFADKAKMVLADHADALGYGAMMTNDQLDEVMEKNDGEMSSLWKVGTMVALNAGGMKLDMASARAIVSGPSMVDSLTDSLKAMGKSKATKVMASMTSYAAKLGAAGITEMPQEFTQSYIEAFNKAYDVKQEDGAKMSAVDAALSEETRTEAAKGAVAGLAGGIHMSGGRQAIPAAMEVGGAVLDAGAAVLDKVIPYEADTSTLATPDAGDMQDTAITTDVVVDNEASVKVLRKDTTAPVTKVVEDNTEENPAEVNTLAEQFDEVYDSSVGELENILELEVASYEEEGLATNINNGANTIMEGLLNVAEQAKAAGAGPNMLAAMEAKITSFIPLQAVKSKQEIADIVNSGTLDTTAKVRTVLGSSATVEDIDTVLASPDITPSQVRALNAKKTAVADYRQVSKEKLLGGGSKPGVFQWLSMIKEGGKLNEVALRNINDFVEGQSAKFNTFNDAVAIWDRENKMPWTVEGHPDYNTYTDDDTKAKSKFSARSKAINDNGASPDVDVTYGDAKFRDIHKTASLLNSLRIENESIQLLNEIANEAAGVKPAKATEPKPSPEAQKPTQEPKKAPEGKSTPVEDKKPSEPSMETPTPVEVADKIATGKPITAADEQVQANEGPAVEAALKKTQLQQDQEFIEADEKNDPIDDKDLEKDTTISRKDTKPVTKAEAVLDDLYEMNKDDEGKTTEYKTKVLELRELVQSTVLINTIESYNDAMLRVLYKDNLKASVAKRVGAILTRGMRDKNPTKTQLEFLRTTLEDITKEQEGKMAKEYTKGKPNAQTEKVKEASQDNTVIGGSQEDQKSKNKDAFKKPLDADVYEDMTDADIAELDRMQAEEDAVAEVTPAPEKVQTNKVIDTDVLQMQLEDLQDDILWLEADRDAATTLKDKTVYTKLIEAAESKADAIIEELGLEGTVGYRLLELAPSKKRKTALLDGEVNPSLNDFFDVKKVYNNLNIAGDIFSRSISDIKEFIGAPSADNKHIKSAVDITNYTKRYINRFIKKGLDQTGISTLDIGNTSGREAYQSISRLLLQGEPGKYTLPDEVSTSMALAINDWLVNIAPARSDRRSTEDTNRLLGKQADDTITQQELNRVKDIDGLVTTAANSLGSIIYKNIGLKISPVKGENREVTEAKFKTELGLMAMAAMEHNNLIKISTKKAVDIFGKDTTNTGDASINVFKLTDSTDNPKTNASILLDRKGNPLSIGARIANDILGTESVMRYPATTPPKKARKVTNSSEMGKYFEIAKTSQEALNKQEDTGWSWTKDFVKSYQDIVSTPGDRDRLKVALGWKDPNTSHVTLEDSVKGKNSAIERDMQQLEEWHAAMEAENKSEMWFPYKFVKNGRFILDTNTFNPQGKKLHRFAVAIRDVEITEAIADDHLMSLAMAFGIDIDKQSKKSALTEWSTRDNELNNLIEEGLSDLDILEEALRTDKPTGKSSWSHDAEHTLAGIVEYRKFNAYMKENETASGFVSRLPLETDAVTSGFILKLLQMPIFKDIKDVYKFLAKGGVFANPTKDTSFGTQAEKADFRDAYNTPADAMVSVLEDVTKGLAKVLPNKAYVNAHKRATEFALGVGVQKAVEIKRSFMKSPFMTFNYGSSLSNIITAISDDATEKLYSDLMSDVDGDAFKQALNVIYTSGVGMEYDYKAKKWMPAKLDKKLVAYARNEASKLEAMSDEDKRTYIIDQKLLDNFSSNISAGVGVALDTTFTETYGEFIEAGRKLNNSFTAMFRLFKVKLDTEVEKQQADKGRHLTAKELDTIISSMSESMPAINTALGDNASKMLIFKTEATNYEKIDGANETGQGKVRRSTKPDLSGQAKRYELIESYASGAVVPIHYIDGSIQSIVLSQEEALGVHDANLFYADNVVSGTRLYNEGTSQVSSEYSLTAEVLSSFNATLNNASQAEIDAVNKQYASENDGDPETAPNVADFHQDMVILHNTAETARETLYGQELRFEHAAYEGSHYDFNTKGAKYKRNNPSVKRNGPKIEEMKENGTEYQASPLDAQDSATMSPTKDLEFEGLSSKTIGANVKRAENSTKKCD